MEFWVAVVPQQFGNFLMTCHAIFIPYPNLTMEKNFSPKEPEWQEEKNVPQETQQARNNSRWKGVDNGEEAVEVSKILKFSHGFGAIWIYHQVLSYILESRVFKNLHKRLKIRGKIY